MAVGLSGEVPADQEPVTSSRELLGLGVDLGQEAFGAALRAADGGDDGPLLAFVGLAA